jgi:peptidyl-prolyl cis-trans isomerase B (cyclophilin B)
MKMKKFAAAAIAVLLIVLSGCSSYSEITGNLASDAPREFEKTNTGDRVISEYLDLSQVDKSYTKAADGEQLKMPQYGEEIVVFETSKGTIKARLFPEQAPITVTSFKHLVACGYYDGITFHRTGDNFMIQTGDPTGTGSGGISAYKEDFEDETVRNLFNLRGALSMANTGYPVTNSSQFFIVQAKDSGYTKSVLLENGWPAWAAEEYAKSGGTPHLDGGYAPDYAHTVFGQVFEGMDVVDAIAAAPTDANMKPLETIEIIKVYLETYN